MPKGKWIDKKNATTYQLLHRPQNDPRIHDAESSSMVFQELAPASKKGRDRKELESDLFGDEASDALSVRDNEGEAAEHGIYYDDTGYDYMQHMRDLGGGTESVWVEAPTADKGKGKEKLSLADALKGLDLEQSTDISKPAEKIRITDESLLPTNNLKKATYQDQQDVPDALAGFQPDMDPRLREVLEALEDDAYVDEDAKDDSFFGDIAQDGQEISLADFEDRFFDEDGEDDGWATDDTAKPAHEYQTSGVPLVPEMEQMPVPSADHVPPDAGPDHGDGDFMASFRNLPKSARAAGGAGAPASITTGASALTEGGRKKKRKGALTSSDAYSMTSSSVYRNEGKTLLDARFEKTLESYIEEEDEDGFADDDDTASVATGRMSVASGLSRASGVSRFSAASGASRSSTQPPDLVVRKDFDSIMDEFLGGHSMAGKKRVKKGRYQNGMQQLDEVRSELGEPVGNEYARQKAFV